MQIYDPDSSGPLFIRANGMTAGAVADAFYMNSAAGPSEIEAAAAPKEGEPAKARKFSMVGYTGGAMSPGGFFHPVVVDLAGMDLGNSERPVLLNHENTLDHVMGQTEKVEVKDGQLIARGTILGDSQPVRDALGLADRGFKFQASIGARVLNREFVAEGSTGKANGRTFNGPVNIVRRSVLGEISFVVLGADDQTSARIAANAAKGTSMDFAQWLEAKGFKLADLSDTQRTNLEALYTAEKNPPSNKPPAGGNNGNGNGHNPETADLDTVLAREKGKADVRKKVVDLTARYLNDFPGHLQIIEAMSRQAIEGEWDERRYELELLRATRPQASRVRSSSTEEGVTGEVIEAAFCMAAGLEKPEKHFSERILDIAAKRWKHGLGLNEMFGFFAHRNGYDGSPRDLRPFLKAAFDDSQERTLLRASSPISTISLPGILATAANRFVRTAFDAVESVWRMIAARRPVKDFRQITTYSLTGDFQYIELPPGGEIKHATVGEETYTNQAKTYARMFALDRRDIKNDDLGAFVQVAKRLGRGGALKLNDVFWTIFMNNGSFFTTGRGNLLAGATAGTNDTRMNIEGLTRAETAFFNMTDPDGKPMAITPRILLVPNALAATASQLMNSTTVGTTTSAPFGGTSNPHAGKFTVARSSYLSNTAYTGNSALAWYLLASPDDVPVIEVVFLDGIEVPTVESADLDFNVLGVQWRAYHDIGAALQEYRGGVRMKGEA